ncbi:MAG: zf-HC2 domain-containing protein [Acidobacteriota bacterium]
MAAETYVLGEMRPEDRDAFEEHFFDCSECASSVRDGATIAAATRSLTGETARHPAFPLWAIAAAAALLILLGYQNLVTIPLLRNTAPIPSARVLHPVSFLTAGTRGGNPIEVTAVRGDDISLYFDVPPQPASSSFTAEILDASGAVRASVPVSARDARETVLVTFPTRNLSPGRYELTVLAAGDRREVVRDPFELRFR